MLLRLLKWYQNLPLEKKIAVLSQIITIITAILKVIMWLCQ